MSVRAVPQIHSGIYQKIVHVFLITIISLARLVTLSVVNATIHAWNVTVLRATIAQVATQVKIGKWIFPQRSANA